MLAKLLRADKIMNWKC